MTAKAVRTPKARKTTRCPWCGEVIWRGNQIASVRRPDGTPGPWVHIRHVIEARQASGSISASGTPARQPSASGSA